VGDPSRRQFPVSEIDIEALPTVGDHSAFEISVIERGAEHRFVLTISRTCLKTWGVTEADEIQCASRLASAIVDRESPLLPAKSYNLTTYGALASLDETVVLIQNEGASQFRVE
jgi:hypothetical protein